MLGNPTKKANCVQKDGRVYELKHKMYCTEMKSNHNRIELNDNHRRKTFRSLQPKFEAFHEHGTTTKFSIQRVGTFRWSTLFVPHYPLHTCMKIKIVMSAPQTLSLQLPSQNQQIPVTLVQSIADSSYHSKLFTLSQNPPISLLPCYDLGRCAPPSNRSFGKSRRPCSTIP